MNEQEKLATEHAEWLAQFMYKIVKIVAKEEFLHGWKHCEEKND